MNKKDKMADNCKSSEQLLGFLKAKAKKHQSLKSYGTENALVPIVRDGVLRLSDGSNWNDKYDSEQFNTKRNEKINFGKCFTYSKSESVAMWLIYSKNSTTNCGLMIDFKKQLNNLIEQVQSVDLFYYSPSEKKRTGKTLTLTRGEFDIFLVDMLYVANESDGSNTIKRSDERVEHIDDNLIDNLGSFTKSYPWAYENECRLIISVDRKKMCDSEYNTAEIAIPEAIRKNLAKNVFLSPLYPCGQCCQITSSASRLTNNIRFE